MKYSRFMIRSICLLLCLYINSISSSYLRHSLVDVEQWSGYDTFISGDTFSFRMNEVRSLAVLVIGHDHADATSFQTSNNSTISPSSSVILSGSLADLTTILAVIAIFVALGPLIMYLSYTRIIKPYLENRSSTQPLSVDRPSLARTATGSTVHNEIQRSLSRTNSGRSNRSTRSTSSNNSRRRSYIEIPTPIRGVSIVDLDSIPTLLSPASIVVLPSDLNSTFTSTMTDSPKSMMQKKIKATTALNVTCVDLVHIESFSDDDLRRFNEGENVDDNDSDTNNHGYPPIDMNEEDSQDGHTEAVNHATEPMQVLLSSLFPPDITLRTFGLEWIQGSPQE